MAAFTGIKDVDLKILSDLNDKDLISTCLVNKYVHKISFDEMFWKNRLYKKYGKRVENIPKLEKRSWKNHYLHILLNLYSNPWKFLRMFKLGNKGLENSYFPQTIGEEVKEVKTNYYLATFGNKIDIEISKNDDHYEFTLTNPIGVSLDEISQKVLETIGFRNNRVVSFDGLEIRDGESYFIDVKNISDPKNIFIHCSLTYRVRL